MKPILLFISLISTTCFAQQYMSKEQIVQEFNKKEVKASSVFKASSLYQENLKKLIPMEKLKPVEKPDIRFAPAANQPILDSVDLRSRDSAVKNQKATSYCTAFALTSIIENLINRDKIIPGLTLSSYHTWSYYKQYNMDVAIKALSKNKICDFVDYPDGGKITAKCVPNKHAMVTQYRQIDQSGIMQSLSNGNPVYFGMSIPRGVANCESVIKDLRVVKNGGHAIEIAGYQKTPNDVLIYVKNSWGPSCGDKGFFYMPLSYCKKSGTYCYFYEVSGVKSKYDSVVVVPTTPVPPQKDPVCIQTKWVIWPFKKKCVAWQ